MITVRKIRIGNPNNPLGEEVVQILTDRLDELEGIRQLETFLNEIECNNPSHADYNNEVVIPANIDDEGGHFEINACCPEFTRRIFDRIRV
jgi:hypothetical protein